MIKVKICESEKIYDNSLDSWIKEQFYLREKAGIKIWYIISIQTDNIILTLSSSGAPRERGKDYIYFNPKEQMIIDLWNEMELENIKNMNTLLRFIYQLKNSIN